MEDQFSPTGGGVNILGETFEANAPFLKARHGGNQMGEGTA